MNQIIGIKLVQNKFQNVWSSFLDGARKEAKELLAKFNARDESRSLLPVDFCSDMSGQKSKVPLFIASHSLSPPKFHAHRAFFIASGLLSILAKNLSFILFNDFSTQMNLFLAAVIWDKGFMT
ncbi:MAG: hypothetical protein AB1600_03680 [Bacteroidota bacterium]